jgi:hypothetical protein
MTEWYGFSVSFFMSLVQLKKAMWLSRIRGDWAVDAINLKLCLCPLLREHFPDLADVLHCAF